MSVPLHLVDDASLHETREIDLNPYKRIEHA